MSRKKISFVLPVYNEEEGISEFHRVLSEVVQSLVSKYDLEIMYVNDGSKDDTPEILRTIADKDPRVKVVYFSRNYGHQVAITAGIDNAAGDAVIVMDTDLQDPPRVCLDLIKEWENGYEVAYAVRKSRKDGAMKKFTAWAFYKLLRSLSDYPIPENTGDFRLLDKKAVLAMRQYREKARYMRGIAAHIGFKQKAVPFDRDERKTGETHYPFRKMLRLSLDAIFSFSNVPLHIMTRFGLIIAFLSIVGVIYAIIAKIFFPAEVVPGWTFITTAIFFIGGMQFVMLGTIGEYIARIYAESKGRPLYLISSIYESGNN